MCYDLADRDGLARCGEFVVHDAVDCCDVVRCVVVADGAASLLILQRSMP